MKISSTQTTLKVGGEEYCKIFGHKPSVTKEKFCVNCGKDLNEQNHSQALKGASYVDKQEEV